MTQPEWDLYFMNLAKVVAENSKCLSRKIGAVLVKDKSVVSTGYNGPARGMKHCSERTVEFFEALDGAISKIRVGADDKTCPRRYLGYGSGQGLHLCQAGHAERNALIQAAKHGISTNGATLYCACPLPCKECMIEIINSGIARLVCLAGKDYDTYSRVLLQESNIECVEI